MSRRAGRGAFGAGGRKLMVGVLTVLFIAAWATPAGAAWSVSIVPTPGATIVPRSLNAVDCSGTMCVAVGYSKVSTLAEHWNGAAWSQNVTPNPVNSQGAHLNAVACTSKTACIAVGYYQTAVYPIMIKTLVEAWNGTSWRIVASPNRAAAFYSRLDGISCLSGTNCYAVGGWGPDGSSPDFTLIEHWDGAHWSLMSSPNGPTPSTSPSSDLAAVSCASATYCIAVGAFLNPSFQVTALLERWNGTKWTRLLTPSGVGATSRLQGVSCARTKYCAATGESLNNDVSLALQSNGSAWSRVATPTFGQFGVDSAPMYAVSCISSTYCVAAGSLRSGTLVERWNGSNWSVKASPNGTSSPSTLLGVRCLKTGCMMVGDTGVFSPLAMKYG